MGRASAKGIIDSMCERSHWRAVIRASRRSCQVRVKQVSFCGMSPALRRECACRQRVSRPSTRFRSTACAAGLTRELTGLIDGPAQRSVGHVVSDHWAFQPLSKPAVPVATHPSVQNAIDRFIFARLKQAELTLSPQADRRTLIRRLHLDLLGIPPTINEVVAFVQDRRVDAYERLVDRTLARPELGEKWAQHWLDVVRYGESDGYETNRERMTAYRYRDYVLAAFNSDKPYDQFVREQLAGDSLGSRLGTSFLVAGPHDIVKSPDVNLTLMQRQDELADMVNTTATTFLGLTIGCARCHNHKFDPIYQTDFFAMQAVFSGVQHGEGVVDDETASTLDQQQDLLRQRKDRLEQELAEFPLRPPVVATVNEEIFEPRRARYVRMTIHRTNGGAPCLDELEVYTVDGSNVALESAGASVSVSGTIDGFDYHQAQHVHDGRYNNEYSWISDTDGTGWVELTLAEIEPIDRIVWGRDRAGGYSDRIAISYDIELSTDKRTWIRVASSDDRFPFGAPRSNEALPTASRPLTDAEQKKLDKQIDELREVQTALDKIAQQAADAPKAYVGKFGDPPVIHRLHRGDPMAPREVVEPNTIALLGDLALTNETAESQRRLALARAFSDRSNPLTPRVIVNRVWQHHFGRGIVATPNDFGAQGVPPTHPELLDWLANYLMERNWSLKELHRLILLSHTYRQANRPREELRGCRRRLSFVVAFSTATIGCRIDSGFTTDDCRNTSATTWRPRFLRVAGYSRECPSLLSQGVLRSE